MTVADVIAGARAKATSKQTEKTDTKLPRPLTITATIPENLQSQIFTILLSATSNEMQLRFAEICKVNSRNTIIQVLSSLTSQKGIGSDAINIRRYIYASQDIENLAAQKDMTPAKIFIRMHDINALWVCALVQARRRAIPSSSMDLITPACCAVQWYHEVMKYENDNEKLSECCSIVPKKDKLTRLAMARLSNCQYKKILELFQEEVPKELSVSDYEPGSLPEDVYDKDLTLRCSQVTHALSSPHFEKSTGKHDPDFLNYSLRLARCVEYIKRVILCRKVLPYVLTESQTKLNHRLHIMADQMCIAIIAREKLSMLTKKGRTKQPRSAVILSLLDMTKPIEFGVELSLARHDVTIEDMKAEYCFLDALDGLRVAKLLSSATFKEQIKKDGSYRNNVSQIMLDEGPTLSDHLADKECDIELKEWEESLFPNLIYDVASAHQRGVFHTDFKLNNIALKSFSEEEERKLVILDLGLASWIRTGAGTRLSFLLEQHRYGAPWYKPPEFSSWNDLYADDAMTSLFNERVEAWVLGCISMHVQAILSGKRIDWIEDILKRKHSNEPAENHDYEACKKWHEKEIQPRLNELRNKKDSDKTQKEKYEWATTKMLAWLQGDRWSVRRAKNFLMEQKLLGDVDEA